MDFLKQFPVRKDFEQDFIFKDKLYFTLRYKQATLQEFRDFFSKTPNQQYEEMLAIILPQIPYSFFGRIFRKIGIKSKFEKSLNIELMIQNIMNNRFRIYESIFTEIDNKKTKKSNSKGFFLGSVRDICQNYMMTPQDLFENYTLEQFFAFLDGIRYNYNNQSKEGQLINKLALTDKEEVKKRAENTKKAFENIKF